MSEEGKAAGDVVVCVAGEGRAAAEVAARGLGRRLVVYGSRQELLAGLEAGEAANWLISPASTTTSREIEQLMGAAGRSRTAIGFLAGWAGASAASAHASKVCAYRCRAPERALIWHAGGLPGSPHGEAGPLRLVEPTGSTLAERLAEPHRLVALMTHGGKVDAYLGHDYLCTLADEGAVAEAQRFLPCADGAPCLRSQLREDGTRNMPARLPAASIAADVVFLGACAGLLGAEATVTPARSLAQQLATSEWAGGIITTFRYASLPRWAALLLWLRLRSGMPLGEICLELNDQTAAQPPPSGRPWVLIGDPAAAPGCGPLPDVQSHLGLGRDRPVSLRMEPGAAYALSLRPESRGDLVLVAPGPDETAANGPVLCERDEANGRVYLVQMGDRALRCDVIAHAPGALPELRCLASLERARPNLEFARRFLDVLSIGPMPVAGHHAATVLALQQALLDAAGEAPVFRYSGPEIGLRRASEAAATRWSYLSHRLLEELMQYLRWSGDGPITGTWWAPAPRPISSGEATCGHCGMTVRVVCSRAASSDRRVATCDNCGLLSETSSDVDELRLAGPASLRQGEQGEYVVSGRWAGGRDWRYLVGELVPEGLPWRTGFSTERVSSSGEGGAFELRLPLRAAANAHIGVYALRAAIVADGHLWVLRRPITIVRQAVDSRRID